MRAGDALTSSAFQNLLPEETPSPRRKPREAQSPLLLHDALSPSLPLSRSHGNTTLQGALAFGLTRLTRADKREEEVGAPSPGSRQTGPTAGRAEPRRVRQLQESQAGSGHVRRRVGSPKRGRRPAPQSPSGHSGIQRAAQNLRPLHSKVMRRRPEPAVEGTKASGAWSCLSISKSERERAAVTSSGAEQEPKGGAAGGFPRNRGPPQPSQGVGTELLSRLITELQLLCLPLPGRSCNPAPRIQIQPPPGPDQRPPRLQSLNSSCVLITILQQTANSRKGTDDLAAAVCSSARPKGQSAHGGP